MDEEFDKNDEKGLQIYLWEFILFEIFIGIKCNLDSVITNPCKCRYCILFESWIKDCRGHGGWQISRACPGTVG